jgi:hypothetical protein
VSAANTKEQSHRSGEGKRTAHQFFSGFAVSKNNARRRRSFESFTAKFDDGCCPQDARRRPFGRDARSNASINFDASASAL